MERHISSLREARKGCDEGVEGRGRERERESVFVGGGGSGEGM